MSESLYEELNAESHEIRLLELAAGQADDPVTATLSTISLDDNSRPTYEALSYVWGDSTITQEINLNSASFSITTNLEAALRRMRLPDRSRMLWADAICINQQNVAERGSQVRIMGRIYSECKRVLVWLGEEEPGDEIAFFFVNSKPKHGFLHNCKAAEDNNEQCQENMVLETLASVVNRSWWSRSWTVQELALGPDVTLHCGSLQTEWHLLVETWLYMVNVSMALSFIWCRTCRNNSDIILKKVSLLSRFRDNFHSGMGNSLLELLVGNRSRQSTDPRDKVYAFLGLAGDSYQINPDYMSSVEDVFVKFPWTSINQSQDLRVISYTAYKASSALQIPSWVPNWTQRSMSDVHQLTRSKYYSMYNACGGHQYIGDLYPFDWCQLLQLCGVKIGEVSQVSERHFTGISWHGLQNWERLSSAEIEPDRAYNLGNCSIKEALWRTVVIDLSMEISPEAIFRRPIPRHYEETFWEVMNKLPNHRDPLAEETEIRLIRMVS
jgi:hypothetical protein